MHNIHCNVLRSFFHIHHRNADLRLIIEEARERRGQVVFSLKSNLIQNQRQRFFSGFRPGGEHPERGKSGAEEGEQGKGKLKKE